MCVKYTNIYGHEVIDFDATEKMARRMTDDSLVRLMRDAEQALECANSIVESGGFSPKQGYYADEIHIYGDELGRRQKERRALG